MNPTEQIEKLTKERDELKRSLEIQLCRWEVCEREFVTTREFKLQTELKAAKKALNDTAKVLLDGASALTEFIPGTKAYLLQAAVDDAHRILYPALYPELKPDA